MHITQQQLAAVAPAGARLYVFLEETCERFRITTPLQEVHLLAQCCHESGGLLRLVENLNYSAQGLANTWPGRYAEPGSKPPRPNALAHRLARDPEAIANHTYANREGNGPIESGHGWLYRGRGLIQNTFLNNYAMVTRRVRAVMPEAPDFVAEPDALALPRWACASAGAFWQANGCGSHADRDDLFAVSGIVNRGDPRKPAHGLDDGDRSDVDTRADWLAQLKRATGVGR